MIKSIAIRGGHNKIATGAKGIIDEVIEDRKVYSSVMKYLQIAGVTVHDVTSELPSINDDLYDGINKANALGVDLFMSIHFNNAYSSYNGALGNEVYVNMNNSESVALGNAIATNLDSLGFKHRGVKDGNGLAEIRATSMKAIIVEVCFVEATEDVQIYNEVGADKIGKIIAESIVGHSINEDKIIIPKVTKYDESRPEGGNIYPLGSHSYIEETSDNRTIIHMDRGNYISIGKGFIDLYWNDNNGNSGNKRIGGN